MSGALPPSSRTTGLRYFAEMAAMILPTRVEPVKLTRFTAGCEMSASATASASLGSWVMTLTTPSPRPASVNTAPIRRWVAGQTSDAFRITVLPQARGMAMALTPRMMGAFHGAIPTTTPAGCRIPMARLPGTSEGITSPEICVVMDAASRNMPAARCTLKCPQPPVAPVSVERIVANCAARASNRSAALLRRLRRALGPNAAHFGKAAAAASAAALASAAEAAAARVATSPEIGFNRSKVAALAAGTSRPAMSNLTSSIVDSGQTVSE